MAHKKKQAAKPQEPTKPAFKTALADIYFHSRGSCPLGVLETATDDLIVLVATLEEAPEGFATSTVIRQMLEIHNVIDLVRRELEAQAKQPTTRATDETRK